MKLRKMLSVLCAIAMLTTAFPLSSVTAVEPLSQYAGQTIAVQAVEETEEGLVSRIVDVSIPEGATEEEAQTLIYATAFHWDTVSAYSSRLSVASLGSKSNFTLTSSETTVLTATLPSEMNEIYASFNIASLDPSTASVEARLKNSKTGTYSTWGTATPLSLPDGRIVKEVVFRTTDIRMNSGDSITVYAKSNAIATINYCNVTAYYR